MRKYQGLFFLLFVLLSACGRNQVPAGILPPSRMVGLLTEIHLADGTMYNTMQLPDSLFKYGFSKYQYLLQRFHTDSVGFRKSMRYYSNDPQLLVTLYGQIAATIKRENDSLNAVYQKEMAVQSRKRQDSLLKLQQSGHPSPSPAAPPSTRFPDRRYLPNSSKKNADPVQ